MTNEFAGKVLASAIKRHLATLADPTAPVTADVIAEKLRKQFRLEGDDSRLLMDRGLEDLKAKFSGPGDAQLEGEALVEMIVQTVRRTIAARSPDSDPMTDYINGSWDATQVAGVVADLKSGATPAGAVAATAGAEVPEPETAPAPSPKVFEPLKMNMIDRRLLKSLGSAISNATGGQIRTGDELFDRMIGAEQRSLSLAAALRAVNERSANGPTDAATVAYAFESTYVDFATVFPKEMVMATQKVSVADLMRETIRVWTSEPRHPEVPAVDPEYQFNAETLSSVLYCVETGENFALVGPTGSGKTKFLEQVAARLGMPFYRIPVDGEMRRRELIGTFKQQVTDKGSMTAWYDGRLTEALRYPSMIDLDEFDRADPDLMYAAHQVLERDCLLILEDGGRRVAMHHALAIGATANTKGRADENGLYANVTELSEASRDRIGFWIDHDYMTEGEELRYLARSFPAMSETVRKSLAGIAADLRTAFKEGRLRTACSTRQIKRTAAMCVRMATHRPEDAAYALALEQVIVNRAVDRSDETAIRQLIKLKRGQA